MRTRPLWLLLPSLLLALALPDCSFAQEHVGRGADSTRRLADPESIRPADLLARVEQLRANVDRLRRYMGKPAPPSPLLQAISARPDEVFSQALNLQLRANRLAFEQVRVVRDEAKPAPGEGHPAECLGVVDSALDAVLLVMRFLRIEPVTAEVAQPVSTSHHDVFNATTAAGAEIDQLLERRTSASQVFQLVTRAVLTAASLHATIPRGPMLPKEPEFEPDKTPADVLTLLQRSLELIQRISATKGLEVIELEAIEPRSDDVAPTDVEDMASLLVEELLDLHARFPSARAAPRSHYPGRRFPAHVYQRAAFLERLLVDLADAYAPGLAPQAAPALGGG